MRFYALVLFVPLLAYADGKKKLSFAKPAKPPMGYMSSCRSGQGTVGKVLLNGMPLCTFDGTVSASSGDNAQPYLLAGTNHLYVQLAKVGDSDSLGAVGLDALADASSEGHSVLELELTHGAFRAGSYSFTFDVPADVAPKGVLMTKAAKLTALSDDDKKAIVALAAAKLTALQNNDKQALAKLEAFSDAEHKRLYGRAPADFDEPGFAKAQAVALAQKKLEGPFDYALIGEGRFVDLSRDGKPLVTVNVGGDEVSVTLRAAKLDGVWTIVR